MHRHEAGPVAGSVAEMPEEYRIKILEGIESSYPGGTQRYDAEVQNFEDGRIAVRNYGDSVEVIDEGAGIEGVREILGPDFFSELPYQQVFETGYEEVEEKAGEYGVEVFGFRDEVVVAGERTEVRELVSEVRNSLGRHDIESSFNYRMSDSRDVEKQETLPSEDTAVAPDGGGKGMPNIVGTGCRKKSEKSKDGGDYNPPA